MDNDWKERYWQLMVSEKFEEAIPLKSENFPKSFFKYKPLTEKAIEEIEHNYIWIADIASLNDPFECSIQFDNDECLRAYYSSNEFNTLFAKITGQRLTKNDITVLTSSEKPFLKYIEICHNKSIPFNLTPEEQLSKIQNRWLEIISETNKRLRICSFSVTKSSLLLWSHYASEHKGIAIEYDFIDTGEIRAFIQPIIYRDKVHKIGIFEEYSTMQMVCSSLIKSKEWEYEKEWRLTIFKQRNAFLQRIIAPSPIGIYLGTKFESNDNSLKDRLHKLAEYRKIPVYKMDKHPNEFKLIESNYKPNS